MDSGVMDGAFGTFVKSKKKERKETESNRRLEGFSAFLSLNHAIHPLGFFFFWVLFRIG